jgi:hypothetical protein
LYAVSFPTTTTQKNAEMPFFHGKDILDDLKKAITAARKYIKDNPGEVGLASAVASILNNWGITYYTTTHKANIPQDHDHGHVED